MSGPIVRTGTTPKFWDNWDKAFGGSDAKKPAKGKKKATKSAGASPKAKAKPAAKKKKSKK